MEEDADEEEVEVLDADDCEDVDAAGAEGSVGKPKISAKKGGGLSEVEVMRETEGRVGIAPPEGFACLELGERTF